MVKCSFQVINDVIEKRGFFEGGDRVTGQKPMCGLVPTIKFKYTETLWRQDCIIETCPIYQIWRKMEESRQ